LQLLEIICFVVAGLGILAFMAALLFSVASNPESKITSWEILRPALVGLAAGIFGLALNHLK